MKRINTSRQAIAAKQRLSNYRPTNVIAAHVIDSTIEIKGLTGQVLHLRAGRTYRVGGLEVKKGSMTVLVASKFTGRYYVCHNHQWSTKDQAVIRKCRAMVLTFAA
jgi:hypothetical protein